LDPIVDIILMLNLHIELLKYFFLTKQGLILTIISTGLFYLYQYLMWTAPDLYATTHGYDSTYVILGVHLAIGTVISFSTQFYFWVKLS